MLLLLLLLLHSFEFTVATHLRQVRLSLNLSNSLRRLSASYIMSSILCFCRFFLPRFASPYSICLVLFFVTVRFTSMNPLFLSILSKPFFLFFFSKEIDLSGSFSLFSFYFNNYSFFLLFCFVFSLFHCISIHFNQVF